MNRRTPSAAGEGWSARRRGPAGFSLSELLVSLGILLVLISLLLPALGRVRESARRTSDVAHLRQLAAATISYAQLNDGTLPVGRMAGAPRGADDYTWTNYTAAWKPLQPLVSDLAAVTSCASVRDGYPAAQDFGQPTDTYANDNANGNRNANSDGNAGGYSYADADNVRVGWIYWGGRDDLWVNGVLKYRSMRHLSDHLTPSSQTLWTCLCWDSAGHGGPSACPHVGTRYVEYQPGVPLQPPPDGLVVALTDGSASFVAWNDLIIIPQANGYKLYYQP